MKNRIQFLFSLDTQNKKQPAKIYTAILKILKQYNRAPARIVQGCYTYNDGRQATETTIRLESSDKHLAKLSQLIMSICARYKQESFLMIINDSCFLCYENHSEYIGSWTRVSPTEAHKNGAYTYDAIDKTYHIAKISQNDTQKNLKN